MEKDSQDNALCSETNETFDAQPQTHLQQAKSERTMEKSGQQENYSKLNSTQSSSPQKQQVVQKSDNKRGSSRAPSSPTKQQQSVTTTKKAQQSSNKVSKENNNTALKSGSRKPGHGANSKYAHYYKTQLGFWWIPHSNRDG